MLLSYFNIFYTRLLEKLGPHYKSYKKSSKQNYQSRNSDENDNGEGEMEQPFTTVQTVATHRACTIWTRTVATVLQTVRVIGCRLWRLSWTRWDAPQIGSDAPLLARVTVLVAVVGTASHTLRAALVRDSFNYLRHLVGTVQDYHRVCDCHVATRWRESYIDGPITNWILPPMVHTHKGPAVVAIIIHKVSLSFRQQNRPANTMYRLIAFSYSLDVIFLFQHIMKRKYGRGGGGGGGGVLN